MILRSLLHFLIQVTMVSTAFAEANNSFPTSFADCQLKIHGCTKLVRPMLNDARYMFPTSLDDVDTMCKMWSSFVDCVRRYMTACSTEEQRSKFHRAVSHSMDTVHAICSSDSHQKDYLRSAHCFRRVSVHSCGQYYRPLVIQAANRQADDTHICCAYGQFKSCVSTPLLRNCGVKVHALLDHSLSYLVSTCSSTFYPLSYRCPTAPPPPPLTTTRTTTPMASVFTDPLNSEYTDDPTNDATRPRTIIYSLPPTLKSRTAGASTLIVSWWMGLVVLISVFSVLWLEAERTCSVCASW